MLLHFAVPRNLLFLPRSNVALGLTSESTHVLHIIICFNSSEQTSVLVSNGKGKVLCFVVACFWPSDFHELAVMILITEAISCLIVCIAAKLLKRARGAQILIVQGGLGLNLLQTSRR